MKKIVVVLAIFLFWQTSLLRGQEIGVSVGYGTYGMSNLQALNDEMIADSPNGVDLDMVNSFPGYLTFGVRFSTPVTETFDLGGDLSLFSTGSRVAYSDYSGHIYFDQKLHGFSFGVIPSFFIVKNEKHIFSFDGRTGMTLSYNYVSSSVRIMDQQDSDGLKFSSLNYFIEPALRFGWALNSSFYLGFRTGYHLAIMKGKLFLEEDNNLYLQTPKGDAKADWSGLRADVSINYYLKK